MPGTTFIARCEECRADRPFEEFSRERRRLSSGRGEGMGGDVQFELEFSFRCTTCGRRHEKVMDKEGQLHKWSGRKHVVFRPGT